MPKKKSSKRYELLKWYLLKICDRGHHTHINLEPSDEGYEQYYQGLPIEPGEAKEVIINEYDNALPKSKSQNTRKLFQRDIDLFRLVERYRIENKVTVENACFDIVDDWPNEIGKELGYDTVEEIYKFYAPIFRFQKGEDPFLNFPLAEAASFALRESKVLRSWYFIDEPAGVYADIHRMFDIPLEKEIEKEIPIYQEARSKAFGVTFVSPFKLLNQSMGSFIDRFENRPEKIKNAIIHVIEKYEYNFEKMVTIYRHYRLIEAEENGQDQGSIYRRLESDLKNIAFPTNHTN